MDLDLFVIFNKSINFIRRLNREFFSNSSFSNLVTNQGYESSEKIQNFSSISLKLFILAKTKTGVWV